MIRKILLFTLLLCAILPAHAETNKFCISSAKLTEMHNETASQDSNTQRAYNELFQTLVNKNESGTVSDAGCVTTQDLAQICKNVWDDVVDACETFVYKITEAATKANFKPLQYSALIEKKDFSDIDPEVFKQAFNKTLARRRDKNIPSKLQDMGGVFLEQAKEKQIDPFLTAGISMYESTYGTSSKARNLNNIAGLQGGSGYIKFSSVPDSIASQAATILKLSYTKDLKGLAYSGHYCEKGVAPKWSADVASIAKVLYRNYNAILQGQK